MTLAQSSLNGLDWVVLGAYFALLAASGFWFARRRQKDTADYFLAARSMPVWAVAISVLATTQSGATFLGAPESSYRGDLTYLSTNIGMIIAALVVAFVFIPAFYRHGVATPYGLLERRFGPSARTSTAWMFMVGRVVASGARLYIVSLAAAMILFGDMEVAHVIVCIAVMAVVGVFYTLVGGIRSVIWTDVIQAVLYLGAAMVAVVVLLDRIPGGMNELLSVLRTAGPDGGSKLTVLRLGLDPASPGLGFDASQAFTLVTAVVAFSLFGIASNGTDNDMVQRLLTCKSARKSSRSLIAATLVGIPAVGLFLVLGLLLYVFYQQPQLMGEHAPAAPSDDTRKIFLEFILNEMPSGMAGLMMAGLFAAGLSSLNSALNAMSSSLVNDVYRPRRPGRPERHYVAAGRIGIIVWGVLLAGFATVCTYWQRASQETLIDFAIGVMALAYSGLLAVFFVALFTRRGNAQSVVAALLVGLLVTLAMKLWPMLWSNAVGEAVLFRYPWLRHTQGIAWPWHLVVGTAIATLVCALGRAPAERAQPRVDAPSPGR